MFYHRSKKLAHMLLAFAACLPIANQRMTYHHLTMLASQGHDTTANMLRPTRNLCIDSMTSICVLPSVPLLHEHMQPRNQLLPSVLALSGKPGAPHAPPNPSFPQTLAARRCTSTVCAGCTPATHPISASCVDAGVLTLIPRRPWTVRFVLIVSRSIEPTNPSQRSVSANGAQQSRYTGLLACCGLVTHARCKRL